MKVKLKKDIQSEEQLFNKNKYEAVDALARQAGFDDNAFACTEFSLMNFFELIVEQCAQVAEQQSANYTGEYKESVGCKDAATAIRAYGKMIGNFK